MPVDDEVARGAEFVMTRTRLEKRSTLQQRESLLHEVPRELVFLAIEYALTHVRIGGRVAAPAHSESAVVRRKRRPAGDSGKVVTRQVGKSEAIVAGRSAEV